MVRIYKKNRLYPGSKLSQDTFITIVFNYAAGETAAKIAKDVGVSRQSVQGIFMALGDRVIEISNGKYPSAETVHAAKMLPLILRKALKVMKYRHAKAEQSFSAAVTYELYRQYKETGQIDVQANSQEHSFHIYNIFRTLHDFSRKSFGITRKNFAKHYAFCKSQYLIGITIIELEEAGLYELKEMSINAERSFFFFRILLLSLYESPLGEPAKIWEE